MHSTSSSACNLNEKKFVAHEGVTGEQYCWSFVPAAEILCSISIPQPPILNIIFK